MAGGVVVAVRLAAIKQRPQHASSYFDVASLASADKLTAPRFALTGEQLLDPRVFWSLGTNPLAWRQADQRSWANREQRLLKICLGGSSDWMTVRGNTPLARVMT
jgi:hypothetical protein